MSMAVDQSLNLKPGMIIQGKYEVVRCLGAGSMGMVYAVKHLDLQGRVLAMKVLFSDVAKDEVQAARFKNEIVASYEVNHPHVVRAYDYFRENDMVAYTMEYVSGGDLADRLNEDEGLSIQEIVQILRQMASGVQAIHEAGIIHRDLKPENVLITEHGDIKITDFGIARNLKGPRLTDHGGIVGTFAYVSPEYLEHGKVDARSDIYSLGVLAYEMVTGEPPYNASNVIEEMHLRLTADPVPPIHLRNDCPKALSDAIMRALARDPSQRFSSAREFNDALFEVDSSADHSDLRVGNAASRSGQPAMPLVKPKVLETEVEFMLQGLKDSLEDRAFYSSRHTDDSDYLHQPAYEREKIYPSVSGESSSYGIYDGIAQQQVAVSRGSLSVDRIKALEKGLERKNPFLMRSFGYIGRTFNITSNILMLLSGLILGVFVIRFFLPDLYSEASTIIFDSLTRFSSESTD